MKQEILRAKISALLNQIGGTDEIYLRKVHQCMSDRNWFTPKEKIDEQFYAVLSDFLEARANALSAESYFGVPAVDLAEKLFSRLPKVSFFEKVQEILYLAGLLFLFIFSQQAHVLDQPLFLAVTISISFCYVFTLNKMMTGNCNGRHKGAGFLYFIGGVLLISSLKELREFLAPFEISLHNTNTFEIIFGLAVWTAILIYLHLKKKNIFLNGMMTTILLLWGIIFRLPITGLAALQNSHLNNGFILLVLFFALAYAQKRRLARKIFTVAKE